MPRDLRSSIVAWCMLVIAVGGASRAGARSGEPDERIDALIAALEAYETAVETITWEQEYYAPPDSVQGSATWTLLERSRRSINPAWCVVLDSEFHAVMPGPEHRREVFRDITVGDGTQKLGWAITEGEGVISELDEYFVGGTQLLRAFGRSVDFDGAPHTAPLSHLLRQAKELTYLPPTPEEPWPGIRGASVLRKFMTDCEIRLDPDHGLAPRVVRIIRPHDGLVANEMTVVDYIDGGGAWVPRICINASSYAQAVADVGSPLAPGRENDFREALTLHGLPPELQRDDVRALVERAQRFEVIDRERRLVAGPLTAMDPGEALGSPQILLIRSVRLDPSQDPLSAFDGVDRGGRMFDGFTGQWIEFGEALRRFVERSPRVGEEATP